MTPARKAVLEALRGAGRPLTAAEVLEGVAGTCDQATVYRALGWLEERGEIQSFSLRCSLHRAERYYMGRAAHHHWLHCESCHRFVDLGDCLLGELAGRIEAERGVRITGHSLELSGLCPECRRKGEGAG